ncbi:response regulator transcription factor [Tannerella sp.]|uniref:response regulator transcription factor n=1 Tax=Tannerella sp. TaxID=2382127 RepID=UPI0026DBA356|nr:response regulator transcription factor [Tannerella sp.]MDO4703276.1 response regulator transcription factor [Tannerella sp.]
MQVKIITVDDHPLIRSGIRLTLLSRKDRYEVVGEAGSGKELFTLLKSGIIPDVILLDIIMPEMSGIEVVKMLHREYPEIAILMLSSESNRNTIFELVKIGIDGYISKNYTDYELFQAIDNVMNGFEYFGRDIAKIIYEIRVSKNKLSDSIFTQRELEIIDLCGKGFSTKEIAEQLFLSARTVSNHKQHIFSKMGINNQYEMIKYAMEKGLITFH